MKGTATLILAAASGVLIGWIDTRPTWDDTGITVGLIVLAAFVTGAILPRKAWLWALAIGGGVAGMNIAFNNSYSAVISLLFALVGAYLGVAVRKSFGINPKKQ